MSSKKAHPLIGSWVNGDEYATEVEYIVSAVGGSLAVRAVDRYDGEEGEVYDVKREGNGLSFAVHWNSTGRFVKARLQPIGPNRVSYTYTVTQSEMWHRKRTGPTAAHHPARPRTLRVRREGGGR